MSVFVYVVTFEQLWRAKAYHEESDLPWPLLLDSDREVYHGFQMYRGSKRRVLGISNWIGYLKLIFVRRELQRPTDDIYQLGGDVLVDPDGIIRLHYVSKTPLDRPSIETIKNVINLP